MKKYFMVTLLALFIAFSWTDVVYATRSIDEIRTVWEEMRPAYLEEIYSEQPSTHLSYLSGRLADGFLMDGLKMSNFVRYLAGIPSDLELDPVLCQQAQYGSVLLAASGKLTHTPSRPSDMDAAFYRQGYQAASSSNLIKWDCTLADSVVEYMADKGKIATLAHRRWILNPQMKRTGFGWAEGYSCMQVLDASRKEIFDYDYIAWPNAGYAPLRVPATGGANACLPDDNADLAWSLTLNPEKYDNTKIQGISVRMVKESDGSVWEFNQKTQGIDEQYFEVETQGYGIPFCIIFQPGQTAGYCAGETYDIQVTGIVDRNGQSCEISYSVTFFDLEG